MSFPPNDEDRAAFRRHMQETAEWDNMVASLFPVNVGMRVEYKDNPGDTGTIIGIELREFPFRVRWDDETAADSVDWYRGDQLRPITS